MGGRPPWHDIRDGGTTTLGAIEVAKWLEGGHDHPTSVVEGWPRLLSNSQ